MELIGVGVLLIVVLGIIVLWMRGVFARDLTQALKRVTQQEQALQEKADILEQRLTQMERDYQAKLKVAQQEAERIIEDAKQQAMNIRTAAIEEAKHRARHLLLEAEQSRTQLKSDVAQELNGQAIQRTCESLRTLLPSAELLALHTTLTTELLRALPQLDVAPFRDAIDRIDVVSAQALTPPQSHQLAQWAMTTLGTQIAVEVRIDPTLVAGLVVRLGPTVVDNSLANRLGQRP